MTSRFMPPAAVSVSWSFGASTFFSAVSVFFQGGVKPLGNVTQPDARHRSTGASADMKRALRMKSVAAAGFRVSLFTTLAPQIRQQSRPTPQPIGDVQVEDLAHL